MIDERRAMRYCKDDLCLIEGYQEAVADKDETWHIHHRRETDEGISRRELIKIGEYFQRPASELLFLKHSEHTALHNLGKHLPDETKQKLSQALSGEKNPMFGNSGEKHPRFGKHCSAETRKKISQALRGKKSPMVGKHLPDETKQKLSLAKLGEKNSAFGKHWWTNGVEDVLARECPPGFHPGHICHRKSPRAAQERGEDHA